MLLPTFAITAHPLVHLNAALNALATVLLVVGFVLVKKGKRKEHGLVMMSAFLVSCLFLVSYLVYHISVGRVDFTHPGFIKTVYLAILISHVVLAVTVPFLAAVTIGFALMGTGFRGAKNLSLTDQYRFMNRHRQLARWTLPIWLYVSVTGVVVYVMLYHLWPPAEL